MKDINFSIGDIVRVVAINRCADTVLNVGSVGKVVSVVRDSRTKRAKVIGIKKKLSDETFGRDCYWLFDSEVVLV